MPDDPRDGFQVAITERGDGTAFLSLGPAQIDITGFRRVSDATQRGTARAGQGDTWRWIVLALLHGWPPAP